MCDIPTLALQVAFARGDAQSCHEYLVRKRDIPIVTRIQNETLLMDARTLNGDFEISECARALGAYFDSLQG